MKKFLILSVVLLSSCANPSTPRDNTKVTDDLVSRLSKIKDVVRAEKKVNTACDVVLYIAQNTQDSPVQAEAANIAPGVAVCVEHIK